MEFDRIAAIGVHRQDKQERSSPEHYFVDIVLIHQHQNDVRSSVYQLKKDAVSLDHASFKDGIDHLTNGAFSRVGELESIDKKKKHLYLTNGDSVTYRHLIVASGIKHPNMDTAEFSMALKALVEALMIQKLPASFAPTVLSPYTPRSKRKQPQFAWLGNSTGSKNIEQIVSAHMLHEEGQLPFFLGNSRLFDLQL